MYFFNKVNFSDNMFAIQKQNDDFHAEVQCFIHSNIYLENKKYFIDVKFQNNAFVDEIHKLEDVIEDKMKCMVNNRIFKVGNCDDFILQRVKVPHKYERICIPILDIDNNKLTSSDVTINAKCIINLIASYVFLHNKKGGIVWSIRKIVVL